MNYRSLGPEGLTHYLAEHSSAPSPALDAVCAQHHAHTALLYWFTDLDLAKAEAARTGRPILSLQLLGRLDEEHSCANSRFFRASLYPRPEIRAVLAQNFVLHWRSIRPVPKVTLDFGDRVLVRTLTGNSLHAVLDARGRPVDAILGLLTPAAFSAALARAHRDAIRVAELADPRDALREIHRTRRALETPPPPNRATRASVLAPSKHMIERPILDAVMPRAPEADTRVAESVLHPAFSRAFAEAPWTDFEPMVDWIYRDLFLMPPDDPWLGLDASEPVALPR